MKYYISAPFGNYLTRPNMYSVMGTFTLYPQKGLFLQLLKTLRYDFQRNGWVNRIGLRNPGIYDGLHKYQMNPQRRRIVSIRGQDHNEWETLSKVTRGVRLELNLSCPNVPYKNNFSTYNTECPVELFDTGNIIVKMSPLTTENEIINLMERGVRKWHFSNTLPIRQGGLSGKTLMAYNKKLIKFTIGEDKYAKVIGGGGITNMSDVRFYKDLGCSGVSLGTICFTWWKLRNIQY